MATVYHRDDAGAPELTYSYSQMGPPNFGALKTILKACLVYGYGSKPAAGWELISESENHLVLRNGSHSGYVCFSWLTGSAVTKIYLSETYTGVSGVVMTGDGLKTGTAANNSAPQRFFTRYLAFASPSTTWHLIADSKTFLLQMTCNNSNSAARVFDNGYAETSYCPAIYVGEDSRGNFISVGGRNDAGASNGDTYFSYMGFTSLRYPASGLLVDTGSISIFTPSLQIAPIQGPTAQLAEVALVPAVWSAEGVVAGRLRGIALPPLVSDCFPSQAAQSLGFSGALNSRNANTPLNFGDGHAYFMGTSDYRGPAKLHTSNPVFW